MMKMEKLERKGKRKKFIKTRKTQKTKKNTFGNPLVDTDKKNKTEKRDKQEIIFTQEEIEMLNTELLESADQNNIEKLKFILKFKDYGIDMNIQDTTGRTSLWFAAFNRRTEMCKLLVESGANVNIQDMNGDTALIRASLNGYTETVKYLLSKGANPFLKTKFLEMTAYSLAENAGKEEAKKIIKEFENLWERLGKKQALILIQNINAAIRDCSPEKMHDIINNV